MLRDAASRAGARLQLGLTVDIVDLGSRVLSTDDGASWGYDVLVGADGVSSTVRRALEEEGGSGGFSCEQRDDFMMCVPLLPHAPQPLASTSLLMY